jgi:hypothetical protein
MKALPGLVVLAGVSVIIGGMRVGSRMATEDPERGKSSTPSMHEKYVGLFRFLKHFIFEFECIVESDSDAE